MHSFFKFTPLSSLFFPVTFPRCVPPGGWVEVPGGWVEVRARWRKGWPEDFDPSTRGNTTGDYNGNTLEKKMENKKVIPLNFKSI